jgi:Tol biopolymer transport system component
MRLPLLLCLLNLTLAIAGEPARLQFSRVGPTRIGLFLAFADGSNEHALLLADSLDYNPSFSADGKWIVFTSERNGSADIFRVHPDGSGLERLTDDPAFDDQGTLSPNGSTLAFVSTRDGGFANLWLEDLSSPSPRAKPIAKVNAGSFRPSWSPDGKWIAFTSDRDTKRARWDGGWELIQSTALYIVRADGSSLRRLTESGGYAGSPQWSADGRRIVFYQSTPKDVYPGRFGRNRPAVSQIVSMDVESGKVHEYTSGPGLKIAPQWLRNGEVGFVQKFGDANGLAFVSGKGGVPGSMRNPSWSPDGKTVVYQKPIDAQRPQMLPAFNHLPQMLPVFSRDPGFSLYRTGNFPAWSPAGDSFATTVGSELQTFDAKGENGRTIYNGGKDGQLTFPAWSPDGKMIAFGFGSYFTGHAKPAVLEIVKADGSGLRTLTQGPGNAGFPSWAPDGKRIVYRVAGSEQGLRILNLADGTVATLTTEYDNFPAWSPKGDLIEFTSFRDGDFEIYTVKPDGSGVRRLTHTGGNDAHGIWSPDGEWIVFSSSRLGWKDEALLSDYGPQPYGELFAMHADGSGARQLTDNQWEDALPAFQPKSK